MEMFLGSSTQPNLYYIRIPCALPNHLPRIGHIAWQYSASSSFVCSPLINVTFVLVRYLSSQHLHAVGPSLETGSHTYLHTPLHCPPPHTLALFAWRAGRCCARCTRSSTRSRRLASRRVTPWLCTCPWSPHNTTTETNPERVWQREVNVGFQCTRRTIAFRRGNKSIIITLYI